MRDCSWVKGFLIIVTGARYLFVVVIRKSGVYFVVYIGADEANMKLIFKFKRYLVVYMLQLSFF